jgi:predicted CopG family antitoxin
MTANKTVRVYRDTWEQLHELKDPGETMDDVVSDLLDDSGESDEKTAEPTP